MGYQHYVQLEDYEIASAMRDDPEWGMQVLAHFAERVDVDNFAEDGVCSRFHEDAVPVLRALADAIEESMKE